MSKSILDRFTEEERRQLIDRLLIGHDLFSVEFEPFADKVDHTKSSEHVFTKQDEINEEYRNYLANYYKYKALIDDDGERHPILEFVETISA